MIELMDGGMGVELFERGVPFDLRYWSAIALLEPLHNHKIIKAHSAFIKAGAKYITTSNYTIIPSEGFTFNEIKKYTELAVSLALKAKKDDKSIKICGSIPPLTETYRPDLVVKSTENIISYKFISGILAEHVDILLAESISTVDEVDMILQATENVNTPLYLSFTLSDDGNFRDETPIVDGVYHAIKNNRVRGILFNCCSPESITIALKKLHSENVLSHLIKNNIKIGAYPNRFEKIDKNWSSANSSRIKLREDTSPDTYISIIPEWIDMGVTLIGGCCGINSSYIKKLSQTSYFN